MIWITTLVGALLGAVLSPLIQDRWDWLVARKHPLSGTWWQIVPKTPGRPRRLDRVQIRAGRQHKVSGRIARLEPGTENAKRWKIIGHRDGNDLSVSFWKLGNHEDHTSFGAIILHLVPESAGREWRGVFYRPGSDLGRADPTASNLEPCPVAWIRSDAPPSDWEERARALAVVLPESPPEEAT